MQRGWTWLKTSLTGLDQIGTWLAPLALRLLLAYEFWQSGVEKFAGDNWFHEIRDRFPFPLHLLPVELSWQVAIWLELLGAAALVMGLGTRIVSLGLSLLTVVAWVSVHAGLGYNVCDNGWKLPLIYLVLFLPLIFSGPGRLSLDALIRDRFLRGERRIWG
ncbi:MAG TPA: DoxX family protein [Thiobacillaceae bacterium]|nr:DoxX family protein [Thiobacillaceae bacterium]